MTGVHGLIVFQGIKDVYIDFKQPKRKKQNKMAEAGASVCMLTPCCLSLKPVRNSGPAHNT